MNLAVMLASNQVPDVAVVAALCRTARARGHRTRLFLVGDGVLAIEAGVELAAAGVEVSLCEADAALRGLHKSGHAGVFFGSLYDWARLAEDADRVLSLA